MAHLFALRRPCDMKIISFGSLNLDHVYRVKRFVRPGETLPCQRYMKFAGGKGANQSVALANAGATVRHAGKIGADGERLKRKLSAQGVDVSLIELSKIPTGHAIIQVNSEGQNCIILFGGANQDVDSQYIQEVLTMCESEDWLLLQNEISNIPEIIHIAHALGVRIVFNPAPYTEDIDDYPLEKVSLIILNELEGQELTDRRFPADILEVLNTRFPSVEAVLTLGAKGAMYQSNGLARRIPAMAVEVRDTTAAGDCFVGYLVASLMEATPLNEAIETACVASAICVTRMGAMDSIPTKGEVISIQSGLRIGSSNSP